MPNFVVSAHRFSHINASSFGNDYREKFDLFDSFIRRCISDRMTNFEKQFSELPESIKLNKTKENCIKIFVHSLLNFMNTSDTFSKSSPLDITDVDKRFSDWWGGFRSVTFSEQFWIFLISKKYDYMKQYFEQYPEMFCKHFLNELIIRSALIHKEYDFLDILIKNGFEISERYLAEICSDKKTMKSYDEFVSGHGCSDDDIRISGFIKKHIPEESRLRFYYYLEEFIGEEEFSRIASSEELPPIFKIDFDLFPLEALTGSTCKNFPFDSNVTVKPSKLSNINSLISGHFEIDDNIHLIFDCSKIDFERESFRIFPIDRFIKRQDDYIIPDGINGLKCLKFFLDKKSAAVNKLLIKKGMIHKGNADEVLKYASENKLIDIIEKIYRQGRSLF